MSTRSGKERLTITRVESFLKKKEIEAQRIAEAALAEDPSVYDYDEVYDAVHKYDHFNSDKV